MDQIPVDLIKADVGQFALGSTNLLILFGIRMNCLRSGRCRSLYLSIRRVRNCSTRRSISFLSTTYTFLYNIVLSRLTTYLEEIFGDPECGFRRNR